MVTTTPSANQLLKAVQEAQNEQPQLSRPRMLELLCSRNDWKPTETRLKKCMGAPNVNAASTAQGTLFADSLRSEIPTFQQTASRSPASNLRFCTPVWSYIIEALFANDPERPNLAAPADVFFARAAMPLWAA
ncbi:hypothetical protein BDZ45DRAFT_743620 [Acephala macrosclerotiorum]|nr:hypothetical protein BDZ45DRAFT_743620 [Acephala macrosclerotiorum]